MDKNEGKKVEVTKLTSGTRLKLDNTPLFRTSTYPVSHRHISGTFYLYNGVEDNGRYKVVGNKQSVRFKPEVMVVEGFITKDDALKSAVK